MQPVSKMLYLLLNDEFHYTKEINMLTGTIKWFNYKKGYGFIEPEASNKDVFLHITQLEKIGLKRLEDGQRVGYELYDDRGRIAAGNIKVL